MKVVVTRWEDDQPIYNTRFLSFATHYGYRPWACRPRRPQTKGKVERPFHYVEMSLLNGRSFRSLEHSNEVTRWWLANVADVRIHRTTEEATARRARRGAAALAAASRARLRHGAGRLSRRRRGRHDSVRQQPVFGALAVGGRDSAGAGDRDRAVRLRPANPATGPAPAVPRSDRATTRSTRPIVRHAIIASKSRFSVSGSPNWAKSRVASWRDC